MLEAPTYRKLAGYYRYRYMKECKVPSGIGNFSAEDIHIGTYIKPAITRAIKYEIIQTTCLLSLCSDLNGYYQINDYDEISLALYLFRYYSRLIGDWDILLPLEETG